MNYILKVFQVILTPEVGWKRLGELYIPSGLLARELFDPLLAVLSLTSFVGMLYGNGGGLSQHLVLAISQFASYMLTLLLGLYVLGMVIGPTGTTEHMERAENYLVCLLTYLAMLSIIKNLLPTPFAPMYLLDLYVGLLAYKGASYVMGENESKGKVWITATVLALLLPWGICQILGLIVK